MENGSDLVLSTENDPLFRDGMDYHARELHRFKRAYDLVGRPEDSKILDIGGYPGTAQLVFGARNRYTSLGLTENDRFLKFLNANGSVHISANIETYCEPSDADILLFMEVIEHLRQPYQALKNLRQIAKPGALIYITTNNARYYGYILKTIAGRNTLDSISTEAAQYPGHTRYYTLPELTNEFIALGFSVLHGKTINLLPAAKYYRNRLFGFSKNALGLLMPAPFASHLEILAKR